jgi:hypothetical protein
MKREIEKGRNDRRWMLLERGKGRRRDRGTGERFGDDGEAMLAHVRWE